MQLAGLEQVEEACRTLDKALRVHLQQVRGHRADVDTARRQCAPHPVDLVEVGKHDECNGRGCRECDRSGVANSVTGRPFARTKANPSHVYPGDPMPPPEAAQRWTQGPPRQPAAATRRPAPPMDPAAARAQVAALAAGLRRVSALLASASRSAASAAADLERLTKGPDRR